MSAAPAHQPRPARARPTEVVDERAIARRAERRRREQHFRRRRRDLVVDGLTGLLVAIIALSVTAGLGVLALLELPLAAILITSSVVERRRLRRSGHPRPKRRA